MRIQEFSPSSSPLGQTAVSGNSTLHQWPCVTTTDLQALEAPSVQQEGHNTVYLAENLALILGLLCQGEVPLCQGEVPSCLGVDPSCLGADLSCLGEVPSYLGVDPSCLGEVPSYLEADPSCLEADPSCLGEGHGEGTTVADHLSSLEGDEAVAVFQKEDVVHEAVHLGALPKEVEAH